jgi:hypothetical protein
MSLAVPARPRRLPPAPPVSSPHQVVVECVRRALEAADASVPEWPAVAEGAAHAAVTMSRQLQAEAREPDVRQATRQRLLDGALAMRRAAEACRDAASFPPLIAVAQLRRALEMLDE